MSRRMFSTDITKNDSFLDMPQTTQNLYFHLGMEADDDGFVGSPRMVMRILGSSQNDYDMLIAKRFILNLENGVCVVKHWRINNQIRKDRYTETKYLDQKVGLYIKENGAYTQDETQGLAVPKGHFSTKELDGIDSGNQVATNGQPSIDKYSIVKVRKVYIYTPDFEEFWKKYPKKTGKPDAFDSWKKTSEEDRANVMADIPNRLANDDKWINGYIKEPKRYLDKRQWEDEIIPPRNNNSKKIYAAD